VVGRELAETGSITVPEGPLAPTVAVPTTLAGADLSTVAGVTAEPSSGLVPAPASGGVSDPRLMPDVVLYDPGLFATTPDRVLRGSAMNGFDKGIETLYARPSTPITDATAMRGLRLLREGFPDLGAQGASRATLGSVIRGTMLVQYGISRPGETTLSIIHAFGHGLREHGLQQGVAHAVVAPAVLAYLFDRVPARRHLLAEALGVGDAPDAAAAVVDAVADVRDALDLPARLRDVDGPEPDDFPAVAERILGDGFMRNAPSGLDPTADGIEGVLRDAW
jgi:alcohol dehydrogenase